MSGSDGLAFMPEVSNRQRPTVIQWTSWTCLSAQNFSTFHEIWFALVGWNPKSNICFHSKSSFWKLFGWRWTGQEKSYLGDGLRRLATHRYYVCDFGHIALGQMSRVTWEEGKNDRYIGNRQVDKSSGVNTTRNQNTPRFTRMLRPSKIEEISEAAMFLIWCFYGTKVGVTWCNYVHLVAKVGVKWTQ